MYLCKLLYDDELSQHCFFSFKTDFLPVCNKYWRKYILPRNKFLFNCLKIIKITLSFFSTNRNPRLHRIIGKFPHLWGSSVEKIYTVKIICAKHAHSSLNENIHAQMSNISHIAENITNCSSATDSSKSTKLCHIRLYTIQKWHSPVVYTCTQQIQQLHTQHAILCN